MFENLVEILKANPRKIVYTEGTDARILESAARLKKGGFLTPVLVGNVEAVKAAAEKGGFDIEGLEILDPATYPGMDEMVETMVALRKGKMTAEECRAALAKGNYFGTMLAKMGVADALLGGATYSTADTVRPALQLVKTRKGAHLEVGGPSGLRKTTLSYNSLAHRTTWLRCDLVLTTRSTPPKWHSRSQAPWLSRMRSRRLSP